MKAIYLKGWIDAQNMDEPTWLDVWKNSAEEAKEDGAGLVVFKIPFEKNTTTADRNAIREIELLLQNKFGT